MLKKAIAVVTSGGDSPGMNAAARAVVRTALYEGVDVYGVHNGYSGMVHDDIEQLTSRSVSDLIQRGGTFLGTARSKTFMTPEGRKTAYENLRKRNIEGLVIIGGDGSLTGGSLLSKETGMPIVGLPGTIDNDVWGMDYTIGCDTACVGASPHHHRRGHGTSLGLAGNDVGHRGRCGVYPRTGGGVRSRGDQP